MKDTYFKDVCANLEQNLTAGKLAVNFQKWAQNIRFLLIFQNFQMMEFFFFDQKIAHIHTLFSF